MEGENLLKENDKFATGSCNGVFEKERVAESHYARKNANMALLLVKAFDGKERQRNVEMDLKKDSLEIPDETPAIHPGAVAVPGAGASDSRSKTVVETETTHEAALGALRNNGWISNDTSDSSSTREEEVLPIATVVEAELVDDDKIHEMADKLSSKEQELQALTEKLKSMEDLQKEVKTLRRKVKTITPVKRVSFMDEEESLPRPKPKPPVRPTKSSRLSAGENYAMKVLLGEIFSSDNFSSAPFSNKAKSKSPTLSKYHADAVASTTKRNQVGTDPGSASGASTTADANTQDVGACCIIL